VCCLALTYGPTPASRLPPSAKEGVIHLVQLLLPVRDNGGQPFPAALWRAVREELAGRFGGLTAYNRAPAEGEWSDDDGARRRDDVVVYEVMDDALDREWWRHFRESLERRFAQEELVVRAERIERL